MFTINIIVKRLETKAASSAFYDMELIWSLSEGPSGTATNPRDTYSFPQHKERRERGQKGERKKKKREATFKQISMRLRGRYKGVKELYRRNCRIIIPSLENS